MYILRATGPHNLFFFCNTGYFTPTEVLKIRQTAWGTVDLEPFLITIRWMMLYFLRPLRPTVLEN